MPMFRVTGGVLNVEAVGYPDNSLPGGGGPVDPGYGVPEGRPDNSLPTPPGLGIWGGGNKPDQGLPGVPGSGRPDHGLPPFAAQLPTPPSRPPGYPDNSLPPIPTQPIYNPVYPSQPIYYPPEGSPEHPIALPPPGSIWPPLPKPPVETDVVIAIVGIPGAGWFYVAIDPNAEWPAQGLPGPQPGTPSTKPLPHPNQPQPKV